MVVWYGVNRMIIHFFKATILQDGFYSIHPYLQIILVENSWCVKEFNQLRPPNMQQRPLPSLLFLSFFFYALRASGFAEKYSQLAKGKFFNPDCDLTELHILYCIYTADSEEEDGEG